MSKELGHVTQRFVCTVYWSNLCRFYTPPSTPALRFFFFFFFSLTTPHAKNKSALEFIFGEVVQQLITTKERSSLCLLLEAQVPEAPSATDTKWSPDQKAERGYSPRSGMVCWLLVPGYTPAASIGVCVRAGVRRSAKSSKYIHTITLCYQEKTIGFFFLNKRSSQ